MSSEITELMTILKARIDEGIKLLEATPIDNEKYRMLLDNILISSNLLGDIETKIQYMQQEMLQPEQREDVERISDEEINIIEEENDNVNN